MHLKSCHICYNARVSNSSIHQGEKQTDPTEVQHCHLSCIPNSNRYQSRNSKLFKVDQSVISMSKWQHWQSVTKCFSKSFRNMFRGGWETCVIGAAKCAASALSCAVGVWASGNRSFQRLQGAFSWTQISPLGLGSGSISPRDVLSIEHIVPAVTLLLKVVATN